MKNNEFSLAYLQMMNPNDYYTLRIIQPEFKSYNYNKNNQELANALYQYAKRFAPQFDYANFQQAQPLSLTNRVRARDRDIQEALDQF